MVEFRLYNEKDNDVDMEMRDVECIEYGGDDKGGRELGEEGLVKRGGDEAEGLLAQLGDNRRGAL